MSENTSQKKLHSHSYEFIKRFEQNDFCKYFLTLAVYYSEGSTKFQSCIKSNCYIKYFIH